MRIPQRQYLVAAGRSFDLKSTPCEKLPHEPATGGVVHRDEHPQALS